MRARRTDFGITTRSCCSAHSRLMKRFVFRREARRRSGSPSEIAALRADWSNAERDRWLTVDRLVRRKPDGTPQMVLTVRASSTRPRFPKPARESVLDRIQAALQQPVPIPIPADRR